MKCLRLVLFLLLSLALPSLGLAAASAVGRCGMIMLDNAAPATITMMSCTHGSPVDKPAAHSTCKMDASCKVFTLDQPLAQAVVWYPQPPAQAFSTPADFPILRQAPDGCWRPPAFY